MKHVAASRSRRNRNFDFNSKRRKEIVLHARHVGAMDTEDRSRWLIAWVWHNPKAEDQIWSVMEAARRMGGKITEAEASAITEEASIIREYRRADNLARFLGVTYDHREALRLTTIGSVNVGRRARKALRRLRARKALAAKRRARGVKPRAEYEVKSLSATRPWEAMNMSRRTWERHRNKRVASVSTPYLLISEDRLATPAGGAGLAERAFGPKIECPRSGRGEAAIIGASGLTSSRTATTLAVDIPISVVPCWVFGRRENSLARAA